jgi:hypothetical protein
LVVVLDGEVLEGLVGGALEDWPDLGGELVVGVFVSHLLELVHLSGELVL